MGAVNKIEIEGSFCSIDEEARCSFCGRTLKEVAGHMIVCSTGASICVECVEVCISIIKERWPAYPYTLSNKQSEGS
jgi:hypothetical protein